MLMARVTHYLGRDSQDDLLAVDGGRAEERAVTKPFACGSDAYLRI